MNLVGWAGNVLLIINRLKWRLTLTNTLITLAAILLVGWWGLVAVTLYLDRLNPSLSGVEVFVEQILPVLAFILPSSLLLVIPAVLVSAYFGFLSARWLDNRLANLRQAISAWQKGDFQVKVLDNHGDEISHFGQELNRMAGELERLIQIQQDVAALEERYRLARDLHDSVKQQMCAAALQLGAAHSLISTDIPAARSSLAESENLIHTAQQELNTIILELRPAVLENRGLAAGLREYTLTWSRQASIAVSLQIQGERRLSPTVELTLFRFAQEALANVARHSAARSVRLHLSYEVHQLILKIEDDGVGFEPDGVSITGQGLKNLRERIEQAGGQFSILSQAGKGTQVLACLPI